jgi:hypothetical protein
VRSVKGPKLCVLFGAGKNITENSEKIISKNSKNRQVLIVFFQKNV